MASNRRQSANNRPAAASAIDAPPAPLNHDDEDDREDEPIGQQLQAAAPGAKKMTLINNGDKLSRGRPYVLNPAKVRTWPAVLEEFAEKLKPTFGAVRRVYTPRQGTEVTSIDQLKSNGVYVLSGTEKFKTIPNGYNAETIMNQQFVAHQPKLSLGASVQPKEPAVAYSGTDMPDLRKTSAQVLMLNVFRNGDDVNPPIKIMLKKFDLYNFIRAKDVISEKVKPTGGFCKSLRTIDGRPLHHVAELKHNGFYVAVGPYEKFRLADYNPDGRPGITVRMKGRASFAATQAATSNQYPEGRKRRRTFVVRLKKADANQPDEDEHDQTEEDTHDSHSAEEEHHDEQHLEEKGQDDHFEEKKAPTRKSVQEKTRDEVIPKKAPERKSVKGKIRDEVHVVEKDHDEHVAEDGVTHDEHPATNEATPGGTSEHAVVSVATEPSLVERHQQHQHHQEQEELDDENDNAPEPTEADRNRQSLVGLTFPEDERFEGQLETVKSEGSHHHMPATTGSAASMALELPPLEESPCTSQEECPIPPPSEVIIPDDIDHAPASHDDLAGDHIVGDHAESDVEQDGYHGEQHSEEHSHDQSHDPEHDYDNEHIKEEHHDVDHDDMPVLKKKKKFGCC